MFHIDHTLAISIYPEIHFSRVDLPAPIIGVMQTTVMRSRCFACPEMPCMPIQRGENRLNFVSIISLLHIRILSHARLVPSDSCPTMVYIAIDVAGNTLSSRV